MIRRPFRPGLAGDPDDSATARRLFEKGSAFEPAHRSLVEVELQTGRKGLAAYDRAAQEFHLWIAGGRRWMKLAPGDVVAWSQRPPKPRQGNPPPKWLEDRLLDYLAARGFVGRSIRTPGVDHDPR